MSKVHIFFQYHISIKKKKFINIKINTEEFCVIKYLKWLDYIKLRLVFFEIQYTISIKSHT